MSIETRLTTAAGAAAIGTGAKELISMVKLIKNFDLARGGRIFSKPEEVMVSIVTAKGTLTTLSQLCEKVDHEARPLISPLLEKAQKKIQFAEKVMNFVLTTHTNSPDPRIEKMLAKLTQMQQAPLPQNANECLPILRKLNRYFETAACKVYRDHIPTDKACANAKSIIAKLEVQAVQAVPLMMVFDLNLFSSQHDHHYQDQACKKMAGACYSAFYLFAAMQEESECGTFLEKVLFPEDALHQWTAQWIKENPSKNTLSASDGLKPFYGEPMYEIPFTESIFSKRPELRQTPLSYPPNADEKEIQRQLDTLIELKNNISKPLGAFIEIGSYTLAIVFHISGRICLYNPYGIGEYVGRSIESQHGNSEQVAQFLKALTASVGPDKAITLIPYSKLEKKLDPETNESSESSDSDESQDDDNNTLDVVQALSKRNTEGYCEALEEMENRKDETFTFRMIDIVQWKIVDRIYFHLYHIQIKETPDKVDRNDQNWGRKAFQTEGLSTPDQKLRAAQRVKLEMLLERLPDYTEHIAAALDTLEQMILDPKDLPQGLNNAAHALYGKLYSAHLEARKENPDLEDPDLEKFQGGFGRAVFRGEIQTHIPDGIKYKVIDEFVQELKSTWRI